MKRSGQVALVLMGVTATTAAGAYMMPRNECRQQAPAQQPAPVRDIMDLGKPTVPQGAAAPGAQQPCSRSSGSSHSRGWHWYSSSSSYDRTSQSRPSTSVAFSSSSGSSSSSPSSSSSSSSSTSSAARGGFGATGHAMSGHSGGHAGS
jgi:hypothetical protein